MKLKLLLLYSSQATYGCLQMKEPQKSGTGPALANPSNVDIISGGALKGNYLFAHVVPPPVADGKGSAEVRARLPEAGKLLPLVGLPVTERMPDDEITFNSEIGSSFITLTRRRAITPLSETICGRMPVGFWRLFHINQLSKKTSKLSFPEG